MIFFLTEAEQGKISRLSQQVTAYQELSFFGLICKNVVAFAL